MPAPYTRRAIAFTTAALWAATMAPQIACADATANAYLGDERQTGQVQPPVVRGPVTATAQAGLPSDAGYAHASANLAAGTLRVTGTSVYAPPFATTTDASAGISDTITITGGAGQMGYLDYSFDGSLGVVNDNIPKSAFAQLNVYIATVATASSRYETLSAYSGNCGSGTNCVVGTSTARTGTLAFQIYSGAPTFFQLSLRGTASVGNSFDFGNTAKFYLRLPTGVSYASASGSFLAAAAPITAVPEPTSAALFLAGVAVLGFVARQRGLNARTAR